MPTTKPIKDDTTETTTATARRTRTAPKPTGGARVSINYTTEDVLLASETAANNANQVNAPVFPFAAFTAKSDRYLQRNTLSYFLNELAETGEDTFLISVMRQADIPSDKFYRPCVMYPEQFDMFHFTLETASGFMQHLIRLNGDSGGRFTIRAASASGEIIHNAVLTNFTIPNPPKQETPFQNTPQQESNMQMLQLVQQIQERSDEKFALLIQSMKPEKDRFAEMAETFLMKKLSEPEKPAEDYNPNKFMQEVMQQQIVMQTLAENIARTFNTAPAEDTTPAWLKFLESNTGQAVAERLANTATTIAAVLAQKAMQPNQNVVNNAAPVNNPQPLNEPQPQPQTPANQVAEIRDMTKLTEQIINELETDNPINAENEVLQELKQDFPDVFAQIEMLCKTQPFEMLLTMLQMFVPEVFESYIDETTNQPNAEGEKMTERLKEFYEFVKGE